MMNDFMPGFLGWGSDSLPALFFLLIYLLILFNFVNNGVAERMYSDNFIEVSEIFISQILNPAMLLIRGIYLNSGSIYL